MATNYFELFGLPVQFDLDEQELRRRYIKNSREYHPDFHTRAEEQDQVEMLERSTENNEAYKILRDWDSRVKYILEIRETLRADEKASLPQDFLMEMMEVNEALMELEFDFDAQKYAEILETIEQQQNTLDEGTRDIFSNYQDGTAEAIEQLGKVKDYYLKRRYLLRIQENLSKFAAEDE